jgi:hypothetical protein
MAREKTIPSPATYVQDFGLNVTPPPAVRNKRIVLLGTAEDGPMYEPIEIQKPEDAEYVWGRLGAGDLVRGIFEAWDVQGGYPTVVGVRIGNGVNANLEIEESTGSGSDQEQGGNWTSLKLEGKFPGQIYNQVSVGYDDNRNVAIYNPKTGLTTTFSIDTENPNNTTVDVHNVAELVDAINNDSNLNSILVASYTPLEADFEVAISGTSTGVNNTTNRVDVRLQDVISAGYVTTSGFMVPNPLRGELSSSNNLSDVLTIEAVSTSEWELIDCNGKAVNKLALMPLDGKSPATWQTIQCLADYNSDAEYIQTPSGNVQSEFIYSVDYAMCDAGNGEGGPSELSGYFTGGTGTNTFRLSVPICPDDSEETYGAGVASGYILGNATYNDYQGNWRNATCSGIATKNVVTSSGTYAQRPEGRITIQVSQSDDPNDFWQTLPYDNTSGVYLSSYASGVAVFSVGPQASGYTSGPLGMLIDTAGNVKEDIYVRVKMHSVKGFLTEKENLNALNTSSPTLTEYFVRGQEVVFNTPPSFDIICNYGTRISYEVGSTVDVTNAAQGWITFNTPGLLPGPGGGSLQNDKKTYIRFNYNFMPNWPNITTAAKALSGGTNGNILNGRQRKEEFIKAYDRLRNYSADIWVPMGAYIDDITERFNPVTGLKEEIPVGYADDLEDFLEDLSINSIQPHAILGVKPMTATSQAAKDLWVKKLTERDLTDPNRGANIMSLIQNKFMSVVAFEPVFLNIGRGRPYSANGQAAYAGMIASMPYDISPTNKAIVGLQNLRYELSTSQYEALNSSRYVVMKTRVGRDPVIVEDITAAPRGSDFINWSTFSITAEAANRVYRIAESFIGRPNSVEIRSSLEQLISNALSAMTGLRAFDFSITSTTTQQVLGVIEIDLILVPIFTIKKIRTTVKLRKNLPVI